MKEALTKAIERGNAKLGERRETIEKLQEQMRRDARAIARYCAECDRIVAELAVLRETEEMAASVEP